LNIIDFMALGFQTAFEPINLFYCFVGVVVGTVIGVLPGLGPVATLSILLPVTYNLPPTAAIIMLSGIYYGAMYGGSTTSILMNLPGEAASVVTCIDGHQMAKQGKAGYALAIAAIGSFVAATVSIIGLSIFAPIISKYALKIGPPEYTTLMILSLTLVTYLSSTSTLKSIITAVIGLLLSCIGMDPEYGMSRLAFDNVKLMGGDGFCCNSNGAFWCWRSFIWS